MPNIEKTDLIADIRRLMTTQPRRQSSYDSFTANKVVDKLLVRLGLIAIIGLLGYIVIRDSARNKQCKCN